MATNFTDLIKNNVAPYSASKIGVYASDGSRVGEIPLGSFKPNYGERLYRFGLLSDVHNEDSQSTENAQDFINALTELNNKESIEFICITGDLTQASHSTGNIATEMTLYQNNLNAAGVNKPVYVTTGNHDCPGSTDVDYTTFYQKAGLSDIAPSSGATASYEVTKTHTTSGGVTVTDHFLFLTMRRYEFTSSTYYDADITWLGNKLEAYKNDRCFVFTHMFFPDYAGNLNRIYPTGNWLSGAQLTSLKNLIDSYPRSYWFSGHSHWKWYLQKYEDKANIYPTSNSGRTTGWAVHIPSCASPIDSDGSSRVSMPLQSEGGVVDVYEDYVDIRGIEFKGPSDSNYNMKYIPVAQYRLYTEAGVEPSTPWNITYYSNNVTLSSYDSTVSRNAPLHIIVTPNSGFAISSLTVEMGGVDVTDTAVSGTTISIASVTGDVVITVSAVSADYSVSYTLNNSVSSNTTTGVVSGSAYSTTITQNSGYKVTGITVTMGGADLSSTAVSVINGVHIINISSVTGDIVITVETAVSLNTLVAKCDAISTGLGLTVADNTYKYLKYDAIKITVNGADVTDTVTSVPATESNSYKVGTYNSNTKYQYVPAGEIIVCDINTNAGYTLPLVQASSTSSCGTTPVYIQLKGIKISNNQIDWIDINDGSVIKNGTAWGKHDIPWGWFENIVDDPTSLTLATTGGTSGQAADTASEEAGEII